MVIYMIHPDFRSIINGETNGSVRENGNAAECCDVQLQEFKSKVYGYVMISATRSFVRSVSNDDNRPLVIIQNKATTSVLQENL
nr:uncharacterized protein LOC113827014 isoform X2 [Penaeus vannamei]